MIVGDNRIVKNPITALSRLFPLGPMLNSKYVKAEPTVIIKMIILII